MHSDGTQGETAASQRAPGCPISDRSRISRRQALGRISAVVGAGAVAWVVPEILTAKPAAGATLSGGAGARRHPAPAAPARRPGPAAPAAGGGPAPAAAGTGGGSGTAADPAPTAPPPTAPPPTAPPPTAPHPTAVTTAATTSLLPVGSPRFHGLQSPARRRDRRGADRRRVGHAALGQPHTERAADVVTGVRPGGEGGLPCLSDGGPTTAGRIAPRT